MNQVLDRSKPFTVRAPEGKVYLLVMDKSDQVPSAFALLGTRAKDKVALRIGGGCKGMSDSDKVAMLEYAVTAFEGYGGVIWSGGNRDLDGQGNTSIMVTDIPGVVALNNPGCVGLGSVPRTQIMTLRGEGRLVLNDYGTVPNPDLTGVLIVQNGADGNLEWDGDLPTYFDAMLKWREYAAFGALGLITWNGGGITGNEIESAMKLKWPVFLVEGSGRVTDEYVAKVRSNDSSLPDGHSLIIVKRDDPGSLRAALIAKGFFPHLA